MNKGRCCRMNYPAGQSRMMGGIRRRLAAEAGTAAGNRAAAQNGPKSNSFS